MSRIQNILARAERDGTARRTQATPSTRPAPPPVPGEVRPFGTSSLFRDASTRPVEVPESAPINGRAAASAILDTHPETPSPAVTNSCAVGPRTAHAVLHPCLVAAIEPQSTAADEYRTVRTRLMLQEERAPIRVALVTSPDKGDGKSLTAANLALTMAQEFHRSVVLMDADLRSPSVHMLFGLDSSPGLSDVLSGTVALDEALVHLSDYGLTVLPAGLPASFPTELLGSTAMRRTIDALRGRFDRVLLDAPAVRPLADVGTVSPIVDGILMVVRAGTTQRPALEEALTAFGDGRVLGIVLNDLP
jgi:protein-tyrosine kinase